MKLSEFKTEYVEYSKGHHAENTTVANELALRKFAEFCDDIDIKDVTTLECDKFMSHGKTNGLRSTTVNNYYRHCKAAFNKAVIWDFLEVSPWDKIKPLRIEKTPPKFLTREQIQKFLPGIKDPYMKTLITAYLATGRRRGELLALKWEDVNFKDHTYRVAAVKGHKEDDLPMSGLFESILQGMDPQPTGKIFSKYLPDTVTHKIKDELRKAGLGDYHLHHLRHSFASLYLMNKGDIRTLKELMMHANINTTMIYSHLTQEHLKKEIDKVNF